MEACGAWGGCTLPKGHNVGKVDIPSNHAAGVTNPELIKIAAEVLIAEGGAPGSNLHSWRCEDKLRYPEGCTCVEDTVADIIYAVLGHLQKEVVALLGMPDARSGMYQNAIRDVLTLMGTVS